MHLKVHVSHSGCGVLQGTVVGQLTPTVGKRSGLNEGHLCCKQCLGGLTHENEHCNFILHVSSVKVGLHPTSTHQKYLKRNCVIIIISNAQKVIKNKNNFADQTVFWLRKQAEYLANSYIWEAGETILQLCLVIYKIMTNPSSGLWQTFSVLIDFLSQLCAAARGSGMSPHTTTPTPQKQTVNHHTTPSFWICYSKNITSKIMWLRKKEKKEKREKHSLHHLTVSDRARQQNVNFLICNLVTGLLAFILLLGLFCWWEKGH